MTDQRAILILADDLIGFDRRNDVAALARSAREAGMVATLVTTDARESLPDPHLQVVRRGGSLAALAREVRVRGGGQGSGLVAAFALGPRAAVLLAALGRRDLPRVVVHRRAERPDALAGMVGQFVKAEGAIHLVAHEALGAEIMQRAGVHPERIVHGRLPLALGVPAVGTPDRLVWIQADAGRCDARAVCQALEILRRYRPEVRTHLVCGGDDLVPTARQDALEGAVELTRIGLDGLPTSLARARLLLVPEESTGHPIAFDLAAASGRGIVAARTPGFEALAAGAPGITWATPGNPAFLADAIDRALALEEAPPAPAIDGVIDPLRWMGG